MTTLKKNEDNNWPIHQQRKELLLNGQKDFWQKRNITHNFENKMVTMLRTLKVKPTEFQSISILHSPLVTHQPSQSKFL